jgi:hypothetical protein
MLMGLEDADDLDNMTIIRTGTISTCFFFFAPGSVRGFFFLRMVELALQMLMGLEDTDDLDNMTIIARS